MDPNMEFQFVHAYGDNPEDSIKKCRTKANALSNDQMKIVDISIQGLLPTERGIFCSMKVTIGKKS